MGARNAIAIDLGQRRVRALLADRTFGPRRGSVLKVKRALIDEFPPGLAFDDPHAVGRWIGQRLSESQFPRGARATIAIGREHVGLKRITLPTTEDSELADMTRLALQRELPFDADAAVIDFVPVERGPSSTTVLAVAVPQPVIDYAWNVARAAGLSIERISLRTMGAAVMLERPSSSSSNGQAAVLDLEAPPSLEATSNGELARSSGHDPESRSGLAIDVTGEGVEFCLVSDGAIRFSRAAAVPQPQDLLSIADAVITETRRTWMSYRVGDDAAAVPLALVMGDRRVSEYSSGPLGEMLKIPVRVLTKHPRVDANGVDMDRLWPLAGLLLEPGLGGELINFAQPRKAPDLGAATRKKRMLAAGLLIVVLLGLWTWAQADLRAARSHAATLQQQRDEAFPAYARYRRDQYKLEHLKRWESVGVDWLEHAMYLSSISPPTHKLVLDSWSGTLVFGGVGYDRKTRRWFAPQNMTIVIDGEALNRETADALREALVKTSVYTTSSTGADTMGGKRMPFGFTYRLHTREASPAHEPEAKEAAPSASAAASSAGEAAP